MLTYILIYLVIGVALSAFSYYDDGTGKDRLALLNPGYLLFFALLWPLIVAYMAHALVTRGSIKYKGKVIWRAKK